MACGGELIIRQAAYSIFCSTQRDLLTAAQRNSAQLVVGQICLLLRPQPQRQRAQLSAYCKQMFAGSPPAGALESSRRQAARSHAMFEPMFAHHKRYGLYT